MHDVMMPPGFTMRKAPGSVPAFFPILCNRDVLRVDHLVFEVFRKSIF